MFSFLFDDNRDGKGALLFENPRAIIRADGPEDVARALAELDAAQKSGLYAAGFLSFELGLLMEPKLAALLPPGRTAPLLMFGVFETASLLENVDDWLAARAGVYEIDAIEPTLTPACYRQKFDRTLDYIAAGDIYQLNLTFKSRFRLKGSPAALFRDLRTKQRVAYGAFIEAGDFSVLSLSPELFIDAGAGRISTRPMKGTARRGITAEEDEALEAWLAADIKSRAENLMILDLMRNDIGRIAVRGSVTVPGMFTVESFETVLQMTSLVEAQLPDGTGFSQILRALFPPGSVTGAPKLRAVEIIRELEDEPRGVYTGAIGFLRPHAGALFNVAIRTLFVGADGRGEIGIGSGVVQDSRADSEYDECLLKLKFLTDPVPSGFELIETLRLDKPGGYVLFDRHLDRLERSARRFGFQFQRATIEDALNAHSANLEGNSHRVRLTLARNGALVITSAPLAAVSPRALTFAMAPKATDPYDIFLYHKTTNRRMLDDARAELQAATGCDEVLFQNTRGELTEGSFTNLFVDIDGRLLTPALTCGLLPGTFRAQLLEEGRAGEAVLTPGDLDRARKVYLGNSVRGLLEAEPVSAVLSQRAAAE